MYIVSLFTHTLGQTCTAFFSMWKIKDVSMIVLTFFVDNAMKNESKWSFIDKKKQIFKIYLKCLKCSAKVSHPFS